MFPKCPALLSAIFPQSLKTDTHDKKNINRFIYTEVAKGVWTKSPTYIEVLVQSKQRVAWDSVSCLNTL